MKNGSRLFALAWVVGVIAAVSTIIVGMFWSDFAVTFGGDAGPGAWLIVLGGLSLIALALVSKRALDDHWPN